MNYSKQRELILNYLKSTVSHPTAEMVYNELRKECPNISLGTVYRNLEKLYLNGDIIKLNLSISKERFDGNTEKHFHGVCKDCGKIEDIFFPYDESLDKKIDSNSNFKVLSHDIIFSIRCLSCSKKIKEES